MEINITAFVTEYEDRMHTLSSSVVESGRQDVGPWTWANAMASMSDPADHLVTGEALAELVDHFADYGAWEREELEEKSAQELNALLVQFIAGDYQEHEEDEDQVKEWGRLYQNDDETEWFYSIGS